MDTRRRGRGAFRAVGVIKHSFTLSVRNSRSEQLESFVAVFKVRSTGGQRIVWALEDCAVSPPGLNSSGLGMDVLWEWFTNRGWYSEEILSFAGAQGSYADDPIWLDDFVTCSCRALNVQKPDIAKQFCCWPLGKVEISRPGHIISSNQTYYWRPFESGSRRHKQLRTATVEPYATHLKHFLAPGKLNPNPPATSLAEHLLRK